MDTQAVAKILDEVIAETGEEEFQRLSGLLTTQDELAPKVGGALKGLSDL